MKKLLFITLVGLVFGISTIYAQGFKEPAEGKAAIYFTRVTAYGFAVSFDFFHQDQYIGSFKKKNYLRYECEPGEQLFWASSENKEFITADLEAGKSYIVMVNVIMGAMKARVGLEPIGPSHKAFDRAVELIKEKEPIKMKDKHFTKMEKKLKKRDFMKKNLDKYHNEWKGSKNFNHISKDMAVPEGKI